MEKKYCTWLDQFQDRISRHNSACSHIRVCQCWHKCSCGLGSKFKDCSPCVECKFYPSLPSSCLSRDDTVHNQSFLSSFPDHYCSFNSTRSAQTMEKGETSYCTVCNGRSICVSICIFVGHDVSPARHGDKLDAQRQACHRASCSRGQKQTDKETQSPFHQLFSFLFTLPSFHRLICAAGPLPTA